MSINDELKNNCIKQLGVFNLDAKTVKLIEKSINDFSVDYAIVNDTPYLLLDIYTNKTSEIISLMKTKDSFLLDAIKNETINISMIAKMNPDELNPEQFQHIKKRKQTEENKRNSKEGSKAYKCSKCKNSNSRLIERQTRSGDEPPTIFVECLECGHKHKL